MYKRDIRGAGISAGIVTRKNDGTVYYDTNVVCKITYDNGVTQNGAHGRFAKFSDTRTQTIVPNTDDYNISLVRASVTTNEIPLFTARPSALITENGVKIWECTAQPGLSLTWTGPVWTASKRAVGPQVTDEAAYLAWPNYGWLPWYTVVTGTDPGAPSTFNNYASGAIDLGAIGGSANKEVTNLLTALQSAINTATGLSTVITISGSGTSKTQQYRLQNTNAFVTLYFDFTLPVGTQQTKTSNASKEGILQAAKILGFAPNQVFAFPPSTTTSFPRAYQLGFRSSITMYAYKTARWVPEDTGAHVPSELDVTNNAFTTYFDCYSYEHFTNQVINPAFQRCIFDEFDTTVVLEQQCLTRQLQAYCNANCAAYLLWTSSTSYALGDVVVLDGIVYIALVANIGQSPFSNADKWQSCGESLNYSYSPGVAYKSGDVVTSPSISGGVLYVEYFMLTGVLTGPPIAGTAANGWNPEATFTAKSGATITKPMVASIGTLAPTITFNSATNLFTLNLDSYGFGGTTFANVDDGYYGSLDDPLNTTHQTQNSSLNDIARDSWGVTGVYADATIKPYTVNRRPLLSFDERANVEVDDYFHNLFGNWPCLRLDYFDPRTQLTTSYVRYIPQAANAGLSVQTPLPLTSPDPATAGLASTYLPYGRIGGSQPYLYTFQQDHPSVGLMWNPVDAIVVVTGNVPIEPDLTTPPYFIDDYGQAASINSAGNFLKILAELTIIPLANQQTGQEFQNEIIFHPITPVVMELQNGRVFNQFDYQLFLRMKETQTYRPLSLSRGGAANLRWALSRK